MATMVGQVGCIERERERGRWWAAMVRVDVGALGG